MSTLTDKFRNLAEYFGVRSQSYFHAPTPIAYDADDLLAYYLDQSLRTQWDGVCDESGLPMITLNGRTDRHPVMICLWALGHIERYRSEATPERRELIESTCRWLIESQQPDGSWRMPFPVRSFGLPLGAPSAMIQGLAISVLIRGFVLFDDDRCLARAVDAMKPFHVPVSRGGVRTSEDDRPFYEEYPCLPPRHVLNGFLFAMWGLYDLVRLYQDEQAYSLWTDGLHTVVDWLPRFDTGYWSLYHIGAGAPNPSTPHYHRLHIEQLKVMTAITEHPVFDKYRHRWEDYLSHRVNVLRTLSAKIRWRVSH
jgi:heparosan-N-sulfate-glucuronate 5-epimerase